MGLSFMTSGDYVAVSLLRWQWDFNGPKSEGPDAPAVMQPPLHGLENPAALSLYHGTYSQGA